MLAALGDHWYEWIGEGIGIVLIGLVVAGSLPVWTLALALLVLLRPLSRLTMVAARAALDA